MTLSAPFPKKPRAKFHRSKGGCLECRSRRKKCDSRKPVCLACESKHLTCRWPDDHRSSPPVAAAAHASTDAGRESRQTSHSDAKAVGNLQVNSFSTGHRISERTPDAGQRQVSVAFPDKQRVQQGAPIPTFSTILSPAAVRTQTGAVAATHLGPEATLRASSPIWGLLDAYSNKNDAFTLAFDALSLTQLGVVRKDQRLIDHAIFSYHAAIHKLQGELVQAASLPTFPATLLGTPYLLFLCERFTPIASLSSSSTGVTAHLTGFAYLVRSKRAAKCKTQLLLLDDFQQFSLGWSMVHRRQLSRHMPQSDLEAIDKIPFRFPKMTKHMMSLPDFFEEADALSLYASVSAEDIDGIRSRGIELLDKLENHQRELEDIFQHWLETQGWPSYEEVDASLLQSHDRHLDTLSRQTFGTAIRMPSYGVAVAYLRYWTSTILLAETDMQVRKATLGDKYETRESLWQKTTRFIEKICKTLIYLCTLREAGAQSLLCNTGALQYIWPWYAAKGHHDKLPWCEALCRYLQAGGMHFPATE